MLISLFLQSVLCIMLVLLVLSKSCKSLYGLNEASGPTLTGEQLPVRKTWWLKPLLLAAEVVTERVGSGLAFRWPPAGSDYFLSLTCFTKFF